MKFVFSKVGVTMVIAVVLVVLLVFVKAFSGEAVYPLERLERGFSRHVYSRLAGMVHGAQAQAENVRLKREVAALSLQLADADKLQEENRHLRQVLAYRDATPQKWIAACTLAHHGGAAGIHQIIRVDKGSLEGVQVGAIVVVPEGVVGRVSAVSPHTAEVTLVTDPWVKIACEVIGPAKESLHGVLMGGDENVLTLRYLSGPIDMPPLSQVLTSGQGGVFPRGLVVGTLRELHTDGRGHATEAEVLPAVDFASLEDVFIRSEK